MTEFVRVSLPNGHEATLSADYVAGTNMQVLDVPATNLRGEPLPVSRKGGRHPKPKTTVAAAAAKKTAQQSASPAPSDDPTNDGVAVTPEEA